MPKSIYYSRAITWYLQNPRVHVSRVQKRVSKLVNFKVQKVQKPDLFYLMNNFPRSHDNILPPTEPQCNSFNISLYSGPLCRASFEKGPGLPNYDLGQNTQVNNLFLNFQLTHFRQLFDVINSQ